MAAALFAGANVRVSELLALRIEKHISDDRTTLYIRQQRGKRGCIKHTLKTDAAYRDVDLHSRLAEMLSDYIGDRKEGFLFQTENGTMLSPENLTGTASRPFSKRWEEHGCGSMRSADSARPCCSRPMPARF